LHIVSVLKILSFAGNPLKTLANPRTKTPLETHGSCFGTAVGMRRFSTAILTPEKAFSCEIIFYGFGDCQTCFNGWEENRFGKGGSPVEKAQKIIRHAGKEHDRRACICRSAGKKRATCP